MDTNLIKKNLNVENGSPTGANKNLQKMKISRVKKKRKQSGGGGPKHSHHRVVTAEVSNNILDQIKEESDPTAEKAPEIKINKILVRTPAVSMENGSKSGSDTPDDNVDDGKKENEKDTATGISNAETMHKSDPPEREVSFSIRSGAVSQPLEDKPRSRRSKRPKSCMRFTKEDMEQFLPRKSFFNSHDKVLTEAGHQVDTHNERKKPDWRSILRMHTMEELYPPKKESEPDNVQPAGLMDDSSESEDELFSIEKTETLLSRENKKSKSRSSSKKAGNPEREEYRPLYDYLKYILDNPDEYVAMTKFTTKNLDHKHPNNLVRMGRIYRRGSNIRNSIYLHALTGLKSGTQEQPANTQQEESELVKLKAKAETWMKGLTTHQYLRAKDLALKDVGDEDINQTKWWSAFKTCQYLRLPKHVSGESH